MTEQAPTRKKSESPGRYLRRVVAYMTEPDRRRMGHATESQIIEAIQELEKK